METNHIRNLASSAKVHLKYFSHLSLIGILIGAIGCGGPSLRNTNTGSQSTVKTAVFSDRDNIAYYYLAVDDSSLGDNFENYEKAWLKLVKCSYPASKLNTIKADAKLHLDAELGDYWLVSEFEKKSECKVLPKSLTNLTTPAALTSKKLPQPMTLSGSGSRGGGGSFWQKLAVPLQMLVSIAFIFHLLFTDYTGQGTIGQKLWKYGKEYVLLPAWRGTKWVFGLIWPGYQESIEDVKRAFPNPWKGQSKKDFYIEWHQSLHEITEIEYNRQQQRRFATLLESYENKWPDLLSRDYNQAVSQLTEPGADDLLHELRKVDANFANWFIDKHTWQARRASVPLLTSDAKWFPWPFKRGDVEKIQDWDRIVRDMNDTKDAAKSKKALKEASEIYRTFRSKWLRLGNVAVTFAVLIGLGYAAKSIFDKMVKEEESDMIFDSFEKSLKRAIASTNLKIKASKTCKDDYLTATNHQNRIDLLRLAVIPECGNFIKHVNSQISERIEMVAFNKTENADVVWDTKRVLFQSVAENYDLAIKLQ